MTNLIYPVAAGGIKKLLDMGDGTHAEITASADRLLEEALGRIDGLSVIQKFGRNAAVASAIGGIGGNGVSAAVDIVAVSA